MARQQVVSYTITCDICGEEIPEDESEDAARKFSLEGSSYEVDICSRHREELDEILEQLKVFVDAGTRQPTGGRGRTRASGSRSSRDRATKSVSKAGSSAPSSDVAAVRAWAIENGLAVGDRGRIPSKITEAYYQARGAQPATAPTRRRRPRKAAVTPQ